MNAVPARRSAVLSLGRPLWVIVHRWAGLTAGLIVLLASFTGMVLPFEETLTFASRPDRSQVSPPTAGAHVLDGIEIARRVEAQTGGLVPRVELQVPTDRVVRMWVAPRRGGPTIPFDVAWADPYTGKVTLKYKWGGIGDGPENIVPFLFSLHRGLFAGRWGVWTFGIAALIWTFDCFIGFYLTFPVRSSTESRRESSWLHRWRSAWLIRRRWGFKLTFDLHRALSLWIWPLLLVFAWSAVGLSTPEISDPVMRLFGAQAEARIQGSAAPLEAPELSPYRAVDIAVHETKTRGGMEGFQYIRAVQLEYNPNGALYTVALRTTLDRTNAGGATTISIDGRTGEVLQFARPIGKAKADVLMQWLYMLHEAATFGLPYRLFVSLLGMTLTAIGVTGIMIWMRKRSARRLKHPVTGSSGQPLP